MRALEAKDFLVQQTAEQAALENVPLSDLEKRMMYFTETDECPEDPIALNDAFEAEYETDEYEAKVRSSCITPTSECAKKIPKSSVVGKKPCRNSPKETTIFWSFVKTAPEHVQLLFS